MQSAADTTTIYHLETGDRHIECPKAAPLEFELVKMAPPDAAINSRMYRSVGADWEWTDRLSWSEESWREYVYRESLQTYIGHVHGRRAGYFELESQENGNVEIAYLGLLPEYIGQGLGGVLLTAAMERAWEIPSTRRLWVHTCTKDHKYALENYRKRGFKVFKVEQ